MPPGPGYTTDPVAHTTLAPTTGGRGVPSSKPRPNSLAQSVVSRGEKLSRNRKKPRSSRPRTIGDRSNATLPFTDEEWGLVKSAADGMSWNLRSSLSPSGRYLPTLEDAPDPSWLGMLVRVLASTGCHISAIPLLNEESVFIDPETGLLSLRWRRPKTRVAITCPVNRSCRAFIHHFCEMRKPRSRSSYNDMLSAISREIANRYQVRTTVAPSRFRHFALTRWWRQRLDPPAILALGGVTLRTLTKYTNRPSSVAAKQVSEELL